MPAALRRVMISRKKLRYKELCATPARGGETSDEQVRYDEIVARLMVLEIVVGIKMYFYHPPFSVRQRTIYFSPTSVSCRSASTTMRDGTRQSAVRARARARSRRSATFIRGPSATHRQSSSIHARPDAGRPIKSHLHGVRRARRGAPALKWPNERRVGARSEDRRRKK